MLSLLPAHELRRTGAPGVVEHALAYFLAAVPLGIGWPRRRGPGPRAILLMGLPTLATLMELLQFLAPGRHPHVSDALASSAGAWAGLALAAALLRHTGAAAAMAPTD